MKKYFEILRKCPLFSQISDENLIPMLGCLKTKVERFDKRHTVLAEGGAAKYVGIVLSGSVQIERTDYFGNRSIVSIAQPSEIFGEAFACAQVDEIPISAVACEPSEIMLIDCLRVMNPCEKPCDFHRRLIFNMLKILAVKNIMFHQKIEITSKRSTKEKLMTYLTICAKKAGSSSFDIPFDRQGLADYLEVDRSGLSAEISKLKRQGIIENHKRNFKLL